MFLMIDSLESITWDLANMGYLALGVATLLPGPWYFPTTWLCVDGRGWRAVAPLPHYTLEQSSV